MFPNNGYLLRRDVKVVSKRFDLPLSSCDLREQIYNSFDVGEQFGIIISATNSMSVDLSQGRYLKNGIKH